ncbi:MAG: hypothetical protein ALECFALPRED_009974 [Alectoria fallacina]|uniref:F-box domain-containing protein n=1 Tax=Alectoria fallacina TaxID=1903189 RepID=A0A8H3EX20_9LECA|nr:MAG: hypothetical protein ALECFALPRED_009974 [Alectoria fallacina]
MAILTDLPNELLLFIIADVSPLYIDSFTLSCKRISCLCTDTIREHDTVRSRIPSLDQNELLRTVISNPHIALYPKFARLRAREDSWDGGAPDDLLSEIDFQTRQNPYTTLLQHIPMETSRMAAPLLITRLLNIQKIEISVTWCQNMLRVLSNVLEASYDPIPKFRAPLPLGKLTEAHVSTFANSVDGLELSILLAALPTLRMLDVGGLERKEPYICPYQRRSSGVTEIILGAHVDFSFLVELIGRTNALQRFTYNHEIHNFSAKLQPRRLTELLEQRAGHGLAYLSLLTRKGEYTAQSCLDLCRNHNDLSLGSLRGFRVLKCLVTCVDMFIKTRGYGEDGIGPVTVQRLVSWLPASLETLVLHPGLEVWDKAVLRMLFRGLRNEKQARIPNLKRINFVGFPDFDHSMPDDIKIGCRETGVRLGYTLHTCRTNCGRALELLQDWEGRPWVEALGDCCGYIDSGW